MYGVKNRLKEIRMREYLMDPQTFASLIGINYKTYYSWERGVAGPSLETALKVAKKLNKKVEDVWYLD
ncbi:helix-turn-helix transcriptional regulator [Clostridium tetani]|nr:helix-turn-helix domain-containing protein [Clostridium tetani]